LKLEIGSASATLGITRKKSQCRDDLIMDPVGCGPYRVRSHEAW